MTFFMNDNEIDTNEERFDYTNFRNGKHSLVIRNIRLSDDGVVTVKTPTHKGDEMAASSAVLEVIKGERAPVFGKMGEDNDRVDGVAGNDLWSLEFDY